MEKRKNTIDTLELLSIIGVTIVALVLVILFKIKAGLWGIGLGTIAVITLVYWLREAKKMFREDDAFLRVKATIDKKGAEAEWLYDLIDEGESIILTAEVPGPAEEVIARLYGGDLEIRGGSGFMRRIRMLKDVELKDLSYINGVLRVRLTKKAANYSE